MQINVQRSSSGCMFSLLVLTGALTRELHHMTPGFLTLTRESTPHEI